MSTCLYCQCFENHQKAHPTFDFQSQTTVFLRFALLHLLRLHKELAGLVYWTILRKAINPIWIFFPNAIPPCRLQLKSRWRHHSKQEMILSSIITKLRTSNIGSQFLWFTHQKIKIAAILNYTANINFLSEHKLYLLLFTEQTQYNEPTRTKKDLSITTISRSLKTSHALIYSHCCSELVSGNFYKYATQQEPWDIQQISLCYSHPFTNAWSDKLGGRPPSPCARAPSVPPPCPWPQEQQPHCHQSPLQLWKMCQEGVVGFILIY